MGGGIGKMAPATVGGGSRKRKHVDNRQMLQPEASPQEANLCGPQLLVFTPELFHSVLGFLTAAEAHRILDAPICHQHRVLMSKDPCVWRELCCSHPWHVERAQLDALCYWFSTKGAKAPLPPLGRYQPKFGSDTKNAMSNGATAYRRLHCTLLQSVQSLRSKSSGPEHRLACICAAMGRFSTVQGIQKEALAACLPLLQAEPMRRKAQASTLSGLIVSCIHTFNHPTLQCLALHALVLLARPLGGHEGAVHVGFAPSLPSLEGPVGGICGVLKLMDQNSDHSRLQAMACWSLVNFALNPSVKSYMLEQGAIQRVLQSMKLHPRDREVQFRAIFSLINLVVPDGNVSIQHHIEDIVHQLLEAMQSFCEDCRLVNRASLVLQNLSLNELNHATLKRPRVQRLLQRSLVQFGASDAVLGQSIRATLMRLFGSAVEELGISALTITPPVDPCFSSCPGRIPVTLQHVPAS